MIGQGLSYIDNLSTLQFHSIVCPVKKCKGRVSFQRASIHFFKLSQTKIMLIKIKHNIYAVSSNAAWH